MFVRRNRRFRELKPQFRVRNVSDKLHMFLKKNKRNVAAACMLLLLAGIAYAAPRAVVAVSQNTASAAKELPIYCVDRQDKVVALTFDAAWGNDRLMEWLRH